MEELNAIVDERVSTDVDSDTLRRGDILSLGQAFFDLLDNPIVLPYLEELLGDDLRWTTSTSTSSAGA